MSNDSGPWDEDAWSDALIAVLVALVVLLAVGGISCQIKINSEPSNGKAATQQELIQPDP